MGWIGQVLRQEFGRAWRATKQAGLLFYDHVGLSVLVSAYWYVFAFLPVTYFLVVATYNADNLFIVFISYLFAALVSIFWAGPVTSVAYSAVYSLIEREGFYIRELFTRIPRYYGKTIAASAVSIAVLFVLLVDFVYFLQSDNTALRWISILFGYLILFWFLSVQYLFPFIVQQNVGIRKTLQRAALVALDNVIVSLLLALAGIVLYLFGLATGGVPLVLVFMGFIAALHHYGLMEILKKYDNPPEGAKTEEGSRE